MQRAIYLFDFQFVNKNMIICQEKFVLAIPAKFVKINPFPNVI